MVSFTVVSSIVDDNTLELSGVSDLHVTSINGVDFLFVASEADGSVSSFRLSDTAAPSLVDTISYGTSSGTLAVSQITIAMVDGVFVLIPSGRYDDDVTTYTIDNAANFISPVVQSPGSSDFGNFLVSQSITIAGNTFLYASRQGGDGFTSYQMNTGSSITHSANYTSAQFDFIGDVAAFATATIGRKTYLFTAAAFDAGINSFRVADSGSLTHKAAVAPGDGSGFSLPQALETVTLGGKTYLLSAAAGSNSLTVYKVSGKGKLTEVDHLIDSVETRFMDASVLESFTYNDRSFILAAGSDDGLTLLELHSGGILSVVAVLADDFDITLDNVTDIEVAILGNEIHLIVGSDTENGFTQFRVDMENTGLAYVGDKTKNTLSGSAQDDLLFGHNGRDTLYGNDGDDRLVDGKGVDQLYGGAGADIFNSYRMVKRISFTTMSRGLTSLICRNSQGFRIWLH